MCGIVGYVGRREAEPILLDGLRRLEYRGYDSAGLATLAGPQLQLRKRAGRVAELASYLQERPAPGTVGISHTRWATHGPANDRNAHPHVSSDGRVAVVHNGVIENYSVLKRQLQTEGVVFHSDTDPRSSRSSSRGTSRAISPAPSLACCRCSRGPTAWRLSARLIPKSW